MKIDHLKEFITLARLLNYSEAAKELYLTQPVLSRHIISLEEECGTPLFVRDTQHVKLTEVGESFVADAREIVRLYDSAMTRLKEKADESEGEVQIGYLAMSVRMFLPDLLIDLKERYPKMEIVPFSLHNEQIVSRLEGNTLDVGFVTNFEPFPGSSLSSYKIYSAKMKLVVRSSHRCVNKEYISIDDIANDVFIVMDENVIINPINPELYIKRRDGQKIAIARSKAKTPEEALLMVESGYGISILPEDTKSMAGSNVRYLDFDGLPDYHVSMIWNKMNTSPVVNKFIRETVKYIKTSLDVGPVWGAESATRLDDDITEE